MTLRLLYIVIIFLISTGCDRPHKPIEPIREWVAVIKATEDMIFNGDPSAFLRSVDMAKMPKEHRERGLNALESWRGVPTGMKLDRREEIDFKDYVPWKDAPEWIRANMPKRSWSGPPDRMIIYYYKPASGGTSTVNFRFAVQQRTEGWVFLAEY